MKKLLATLVILGAVLGTPVFSQNRICLSQNQKALVKLPKNLKRNYDLAQFVEAYQFYNRTASPTLKGNYCVFEGKSQSKKKSDNTPSYLSEIIYVSSDEENYDDLLYISDTDYYVPINSLKILYGRNYLKFDDYGNCFIAVQKNISKQKGVLMYSPSQNTKTFFALPDTFPKLQDYEISGNGNILLINGQKITDYSEQQTFIYNTKTEDAAPEELFEMPLEELSSIVYNPDEQTFYVLYVLYTKLLDDYERAGIATVKGDTQYFTRSSVTLNPRTEITGSNITDFWGNIFLWNETDRKIYELNYYRYQRKYAAYIYDLTCKNGTYEFANVNATGSIDFWYSEKSVYRDFLKSTPLGLYIRDGNDRVYLYYKNELIKTTEEDFQRQLEEYYERLLKANNAELLENQIKTQKEIIILMATVLGIVIIILITTLLILFITQKKLQNKILQKKMLTFQETERAKLSRDIHDSVVQDIRAIRLQTEILDVGQNEKALAQKNRVIDDITQTIVKMRNICYNLTPAELMTHQENDDAQIELISIYDSLCHQFYEKSKIPCSIQIAPNLIYPKFDKEVSLHLVRIFQEILNNIEKHSYATNVNVLVRNKTEDDQNYLVIFIIDDGVGCNLDEVLKNRKKNHFGLQNMQERMELVSGTIEFFSSPNEGMKIKMTVKI